jgi:hypothetical protein
VSRVPSYSSGQSMSVVRLSNDDCCAVDLMLERSGDAGPQGINNCFTVAPSADMQQRLTRVEHLLHVLDAHPVTDPASDLVARTLARCEQQARSTPAQSVPAQPLVAPATAS